jgi:uncharacterized membrane protein
MFVVILPQFGFGGTVIRIYPCLAAGYFILFIMYAAIIFLYYFNDLTGALRTAVVFCAATFLFSMKATTFPVIWYGIGLTIGAFLGWATAYGRLRWLEKNFDEHVFCDGTLIKKGVGPHPSNKVFDRYEIERQKLRDQKKRKKSRNKK